MDQLKPYLSALKQHYFWIVLGIVVITSTVVWYMAVGELDQKFTADKQKNDSAFMQVSPLRNDVGTNSPPNAKYKEAVEKKTKELEAAVIEAWQTLFDRQKGVLVVNNRVPELVPYLIDEKYFQRDIPPGIRDVYHNNEVIEADFAELFKILDLRRPRGINPVDEGNPAVTPQPGAPEGLVVWNVKPTPRLLMQRYKTKLTPSTARIRMTQEDLWVFRSMFKVIANINKKPIDAWLRIMEGGEDSAATVDQANVPIKQINYCDLAQYAMSVAIGSPGQVQIGDQSDPNNRNVAGQLGGGAGFSVGTNGSEEEDKKLREGRYIDGRNQPVADPNSPPFTEFKQIFVQMTVVMDQRLVPVLVAECANADITIETRQVLVDLRQIDELRRGDAAQANQVVHRIEQSPHDAVVTIRGVVFGYSPPDAARLGQGSDPEPSNRDYGVPGKLLDAVSY